MPDSLLAIAPATNRAIMVRLLALPTGEAKF